jgi:type II secretory pathway pseudopilin PulG
MVIVIVVIGLAIPVLVRNWADVSIRSVQSEAVSDAVFYGQRLMEEIKSKLFDEVLSDPWTPESGFGAKLPDDQDETGRALYDDVDDFHGFNETAANGFKTNVSVEYANVTNSVWQAAGRITDYKRITVTVSWSRMKGGQAALVTIVGKY